MNTFGADTDDDATDWGQENVETKYSYDPACEALAVHFMPNGSAAAIRELAQALQDTVEAFCCDPLEK